MSNTSIPVWQGDTIYSARTGGPLVCLRSGTAKSFGARIGVTAQRNGASINITPQAAHFFYLPTKGNLIRAQLSPAGYRELVRESSD